MSGLLSPDFGVAVFPQFVSDSLFDGIGSFGPQCEENPLILLKDCQTLRSAYGFRLKESCRWSSSLTNMIKVRLTLYFLHLKHYRRKFGVCVYVCVLCRLLSFYIGRYLYIRLETDSPNTPGSLDGFSILLPFYGPVLITSKV